MRTVLLALAGLLLTTATLAQRTVRLTGNVPGMTDRTIYLRKTDNSNSKVQTVDQVQSRGGRFEFSRSIPEVDFYSVVADGLPGQVQFIWDGEVRLEGQPDAFREATVSGSSLTDEWLRFQAEVERPYRDTLMTLYNDRQRTPADTALRGKVTREETRLRQQQYRIVQDRIRRQPNSLLSLYLLNWYWTNFTPADARSLYNQLDATLKAHTVARRLERQLAR